MRRPELPVVAVAAALLLSLPLVLSAAACRQGHQRTPRPVPTRPEDDPAVTLVVRALNDSLNRSLVPVKLFVDGRLMVEETLDSRPPCPNCALPPNKTFCLRLPEGKHLVRVETADERKLSAEKEVVVKGKSWLLVVHGGWPLRKPGVADALVLETSATPITLD